MMRITVLTNDSEAASGKADLIRTTVLTNDSEPSLIGCNIKVDFADNYFTPRIDC